jgi:SAM-dependent methyltransferase
VVEPGAGDPAAELRAVLLDLLLDRDGLHRAVASGRQRGHEPPWRRVELRYVDLKAGRRLQQTSYDATQAFTTNHDEAAAPEAVERLLADGFAHWHVESATGTVQARVTKKGKVLVHRSAATTAAPDRSHDRAKQRLLPEDDPVLVELGISDQQGRVKPSRQAKYRQVEELVRALDAALDDAIASGAVRTPTAEDPLRVVDLGCGNAYLTFAAHRFLTAVRGLPVHTTGVDVKHQSREHNEAVAERLGLGEATAFVVAGIEGWTPSARPDVVLALHACDTATDDALAQAVGWGAPLVLAAPCCHHDLSAQLRDATPPPGHAALLRDGILRERFADTLTDAVRALLLRTRGYRVDVVEFVESAHTPRNTLLRAVRTGADGADAQAELDALLAQWPVRPALAALLEQPR